MQYQTTAAFLLFAISVAEVCAQPDTVWTQVIGDEETADYCYALVEDSSGDLVMVGNSRLTPSNTQVRLVSMNLDGEANWDTLYGGAGHEICYAAIQSESGAYVAAGSLTTRLGVIHRDFLFMNVAEGGFIQRDYGGSDNEVALAICEVPRAGFALAGYTQSFAIGGDDFWLVRVNASGDSLWSRNYGGTGHEQCNAILRTEDSGFLMVGWTESFGDADRSLWIVKADSTGDSLWSRTYGEDGTNEGADVLPAADGGFVIAGHHSFNYWLLRLDANGDTLWTQVYDEGYHCRAMARTIDNGFVLAGDSQEGGFEGWNGYCLKVDSAGNPLWRISYDSSLEDHFWDVTQLEDGSFVLAGETVDPVNEQSMWIVRLGADVPRLTVHLAENGDRIELRWYAPLTGLYQLFSTQNPNANAWPLRQDWTWMGDLTANRYGWFRIDDARPLGETVRYVVVRTGL